MKNTLRFAFGIVAVVFALGFPVAAAPVALTVKPTQINVNGRSAEVFEIVREDGNRGLVVDQKDGFHVIVKNQMPVPTGIHWHGLIVPNPQDGVPFVTQEPIPPGGEQEYQFPLVQQGTYWMHSHYGLQEQVLVSAPLIVLNEEERAKADQEVVIILNDFSFQRPREILNALRRTKKRRKGMEEKTQSSRIQVWDDNAKRFVWRVIDAPPVDIDVKYDALLANRRTLENPEVIPVGADQTVLLRIIAGSSATNFFIDTGTLDAELLAVDGQGVEMLRGNFFQLAIAQRIDLRVRIPAEGGAFPILALGEGTRLRAGVILATPGAEIPKLKAEGEEYAGALDNTQELRLRAAKPLAPRPVDRELPSELGGKMEGYVWTINGKSYPNRDSLDVREGDRVEMTITNRTMMSHPMHLHGHVFQVVEIDGASVDGAMRDTVLVPPGGTIKIQFDANNPGVWAYHCHILYHLVSGMFTVVKYEGFDASQWQPEKTTVELLEKLP